MQSKKLGSPGHASKTDKTNEMKKVVVKKSTVFSFNSVSAKTGEDGSKLGTI